MIKKNYFKGFFKKYAFVLAFVCFIFILFILLSFPIRFYIGKYVDVPNSKYAKAYTNFANNIWPDSNEFCSITTKILQKKKLVNAKKGDIVTLGFYGNDEMEWIVLKRDNDHLFLMLNQAVIPIMPFCPNKTEIDISENYVDKFLQSSFYEKSFSDWNKSLIGTYKISEVNKSVVNEYKEYSKFKVKGGVIKSK